MADWDKDKHVKGDFNASSLLSLCSMAYDSFYDRLNTSQKKACLLYTSMRWHGLIMQ